MKFHRSASDEEIVAASLSKLLGFAEQDIAVGLNVSIGTVRYRIGKAVRQIGAAV
jgi:DNA-directed RNA polymerase specialized sigma24 family protein